MKSQVENNAYEQKAQNLTNLEQMTWVQLVHCQPPYLAWVSQHPVPARVGIGVPACQCLAKVPTSPVTTHSYQQTQVLWPDLVGGRKEGRKECLLQVC